MHLVQKCLLTCTCLHWEAKLYSGCDCLVSAISTYQGNAIQQKENKKGKKDSSF